MPEAHTLLMVVASVSGGQPDPRTTWRAGAWPAPAEMTWPMKSSWMSEGWRLAREMAALTTVMPRWVAGTVEREPWNLPTGVRAADRISSYKYKINLERRILGKQRWGGWGGGSGGYMWD